MTATNRRQMARVRNAFLGATALAGIAALSTPASAITINDGLSPNDPTVIDDGGVANANLITGVGQMVIDQQNGFIGLCTVSLINPRTVIFASHCVNENSSETAFKNATTYGAKFGGSPIAFFFNTNNNVAGNSAIGHWLNGNPATGQAQYQTNVADHAYNSNFVTYNTNCCTIGVANNFLQSDVAMAALDTPAIGIPTWTLLFSPLSAPAHATIEGYGDNGTGTSGQGTIDYKRRIAENIVSVLGSLDDQDTVLFGAPDGLPANLYMADFNDPKFNTAQANQFDFNIFHDVALPHEGITAPGDSGGPLVIDHQFAAPTIAAVLSGGDRFFNAQPGASYGTTSFYQPLYLYWDWIVANNPYKYVGDKAGGGSWTDPTHWVMNLDPAYMTIGANGQLVNALPTTPAQGQANIPPGFGEVCYFDDCVNIKTGAHTNPTPPATPGPTDGTAPTGSTLSSSPARVGTGPFGGLLGQAGFDALVDSYVAANSGASGGPEVVSASTIDGTNPSSDPAVVASGADGSILSPDSNALSNWTNPENSGTVGNQPIIGLPGTTLTQSPQDFDGNPTTGAPARYYDVTLAANGVTTLSGANVTVDKLTINGASTGLTIAAGAGLTTLIVTNSFAGTTTVNGTLSSPNGVQMFGGLLQGTGTVNAAVGGVSFMLGAVAPGTNGTIGTLTINGPVVFGAGSTTLIDVTNTATDLLAVTGNVTLGGTLMVEPLVAPHWHDSHVFLTATGTVTGGYNAVPDTFVGLLYPTVTQQVVGGVTREVVTVQAETFAQFMAGGGTTDQKTIAGALDALRGTHYADLAPIYQALDTLSDAQLTQAIGNFETLAPDTERAAPLVEDMIQSNFDNMVWQRLYAVGGTPDGSRSAGLSIDSEGLKMALVSAGGTTPGSQQLVAMGMGIATNPGAGNPMPGAAVSPSAAEGSWMELPAGLGGFLSGSALNGSVEIGGGGGRAKVNGMVIGGGLDIAAGDGLTVGVSVGYSDASASLLSRPATLQTETIQGAIYGRYDFGNNYILEGFGAYGHQTIQSRRLAIVGATTYDLSGHTGGDLPSVGGYLGRAFRFDLSDAAFKIVPSFSLQYAEANVDAFSETGGAAAFTFAAYGERTILSRLGFDSQTTFDLDSVHVTPNVHAFWVNNFGHANVIDAAFAAAPSSIMTFEMPARQHSYAELGGGLDFDLGDMLGTDATLSARYDAQTRSDVSYGAWTGRLSIKF
ncbi:MAG: autotransporter domain-containing protein [Rhizomicrobium sp.]